MKYHQPQQGYSLVEVLVAISVLLISLVGPLTIAAKGLQNAIIAKHQNTAFYLAQEGLEAAVTVRENNGLRFFMGTQTDPWQTFDTYESISFCSAGLPCGWDPIGRSLFFCHVSGRTCDVYQQTAGAGLYHHNAAGDATDYRREIVLEYGADVVRVQSIVTWGPGSDERVTLSMYLYNIYEN